MNRASAKTPNNTRRVAAFSLLAEAPWPRRAFFESLCHDFFPRTETSKPSVCTAEDRVSQPHRIRVILQRPIRAMASMGQGQLQNEHPEKGIAGEVGQANGNATVMPERIAGQTGDGRIHRAFHREERTHHRIQGKTSTERSMSGKHYRTQSAKHGHNQTGFYGQTMSRFHRHHSEYLSDYFQ